MEGDIGRSHITAGVKKVHLVAFLCGIVAKKFTFESTRASLERKEE